MSARHLVVNVVSQRIGPVIVRLDINSLKHTYFFGKDCLAGPRNMPSSIEKNIQTHGDNCIIIRCKSCLWLLERKKDSSNKLTS